MEKVSRPRIVDGSKLFFKKKIKQTNKQTNTLVIGLTVDHELADKLERERVEKRGGVVEM